MIESESALKEHANGIPIPGLYGTVINYFFSLKTVHPKSWSFPNGSQSTRKHGCLLAAVLFCIMDHLASGWALGGFSISFYRDL